MVDDAGGDDDELARVERIECNEERSVLGWRNEFGRFYSRDWVMRIEKSGLWLWGRNMQAREQEW